MRDKKLILDRYSGSLGLVHEHRRNVMENVIGSKRQRKDLSSCKKNDPEILTAPPSPALQACIDHRFSGVDCMWFVT
jgi:hypothetical protein